MVPSYGAAPVDIKESIELISSGKVNAGKIITHRLPLKDAAKGFKLVAEGKESLKVVIEPQK
jgi:L-iditol 2-dehydrogenase